MTYFVIVIALLTVALFLFWEIEKKILYSPIHHPNRTFFDENLQHYSLHYIEVAKGVVVEGVVYTPKVSCNATILYFGGKEQDSVALVEKLSQEYEKSRIIAFNYRAYGKSSGKPTQKYIFSDALFIYDTMQKEYGKLTLMGYSLGSSVASYVASKRAPKRLILISAFDSVMAFAQKKYPYIPKQLFKNPYRSDIYVQEVSSPTYLYVTIDDNVVNIDQARILHKNINNLVEYKEYSGYNHSSLLMSDEVVEKVKGILDNA